MRRASERADCGSKLTVAAAADVSTADMWWLHLSLHVDVHIASGVGVAHRRARGKQLRDGVRAAVLLVVLLLVCHRLLLQLLQVLRVGIVLRRVILLLCRVVLLLLLLHLRVRLLLHVGVLLLLHLRMLLLLLHLGMLVLDVAVLLLLLHLGVLLLLLLRVVVLLHVLLVQRRNYVLQPRMHTVRQVIGIILFQGEQQIWT